MPTLCTSIFSFFNKACSTMSGISFFKRHKDFFTDQILRRGNRAAFADQLRDAVGQNIDHADFLPLVAQVYADIARTHHHFKLPACHACAQLVGRTPNLERHVRLFRQLALQRRYGNGDAGQRRRAVMVNCSFPAANSEGETPAAARAAVIFKKSRLFSSIFQSPYRIRLKYGGLTLNQYGVASPCSTICTVCSFVALF